MNCYSGVYFKTMISSGSGGNSNASPFSFCSSKTIKSMILQNNPGIILNIYHGPYFDMVRQLISHDRFKDSLKSNNQRKPFLQLSSIETNDLKERKRNRKEEREEIKTGENKIRWNDGRMTNVIIWAWMGTRKMAIKRRCKLAELRKRMTAVSRFLCCTLFSSCTFSSQIIFSVDRNSAQTTESGFPSFHSVNDECIYVFLLRSISNAAEISLSH